MNVEEFTWNSLFFAARPATKSQIELIFVEPRPYKIRKDGYFPGKSAVFKKRSGFPGFFGLCFHCCKACSSSFITLQCFFSVVYTRKLFQRHPWGYRAAFLAFTLFCSRGNDELFLLYLCVIAQNYQLPVLMCARYLHNLSQKLMGKHVKHYVSLDILGCFWP